MSPTTLDTRPPRTLAADKLARALYRRPLYPHQLEAAAAISEKVPGSAGVYAYPRVVMLWPRQTGKTTLLLLLALSRALALPDFRSVYAAQTGHITTKRFTEWQTLTGRHTRDFRNRKSAGTERITAIATGGYLEAFPPIPGRLRSAALDLVIVDEAQEHHDDLGQKLDADIVPTFDTRPRGQLIIAGTAGGLDAEYFRRHYRLAKDHAPGYLLVEHGTPPAGAPLDDPATWAASHPGAVHGLTTVDKLADARTTLGPQRFGREYLNQWDTAGTDSAIPASSWNACRDPAAHVAGTPAAALEIDPDRDTGVIAVAGPSSTAGAMHVDIIGPFPLAGLVDAAVRLIVRPAPGDSTALEGTRVAVDPQAPTVTHIDALRRARVPTRAVTFVELVKASATFYDRVVAGTLTHTGEPLLDVAASAAKTRPVGARWAWDRLAPSGHVLTAASLAVWAATERDNTPPRTFASG